jgi:protein-tyrosine phosphatase
MMTTAYWIPGPWRGRLAILPRPRGGEWLADEVAAWLAAGIDVVVSALEDSEIEELELGEEHAACRAEGIEFVRFPIPDRGIPAALRPAAELIRQLEARLGEGKNVALHCRQGVGRSAILAASLLVTAGVDAAGALERVRNARGCPVPDTPEQRAWVERFAREVVVGPRI